MRGLWTKKRMLSIFRFGTELVGKVPKSEDGPLDLVVKLLAVGDSYEKCFGGRSSVYQNIFARHDLRERSSEAFVKMFWNSGLHKSFTVVRHGVSDWLELLEAVHPSGERLFFQEHRYGRPTVSGEFFHTPRFDFESLCDSLWALHPNGILLSTESQNRSSEVSFSTVDEDSGHLTSAGRARVAELVAESVSQTILLHGPPGTGKSTAVIRASRQSGGRLLAVDASSIQHMGLQELAFIVEAFRPRSLLIDDFDRAPVEEIRPRVLLLFQRLKALSGGMTVFITVNDSSKLDAALLRSGRIDLAVSFGLPGPEESRELLEEFSDSPDLPPVDGFSQADLAGLVRHARRVGMGRAVPRVLELRALAARAGQTPPT